MKFYPRTLPLLATLFFVPAVSTYIVENQGFNMLDDGLWVLGTRIIAQVGLLYCDIFSIYGPAKYYALLPFFWLLGASVHSLVVFKAVLAGSASVFGFLVSRRYGAKHLAWLLPISVVALGPIPPRYFFAAAFAVFNAEMLSRPRRLFTDGLFVGLAWGCLALFGLDMLACGLIVIVAGNVFSRQLAATPPSSSSLSITGILAGFAGIVGLFLLFSVFSNTLNLVVWDTIVCPLSYSPNHIGMNLLDGGLHPKDFGMAFSQVFTGEHLDPILPGHVGLRVVASHLMRIFIFVTPFLFFLARGTKFDPRVGSLFALALASWVILLWSNSVPHVFAAFYGTLLALVCFLNESRWPRVPIVLLSFIFLGTIMSPFAGERFWLMVHANRPSLVHWDRPAARISMARNRHATIERVLNRPGIAGDSIL